MDQIFIRDLLARCIVGIFPEEKNVKQDVLVNIALETDLATAGQTDDIDDTVDYKSLKQSILARIEATPYNLIERLAQDVADICLATERVAAVKVTVDKPGALRFARSVAVEIRRTKGD
jgi:dihydroneopterin aldolase/D-erythro-7,8-dihydroneopterin triphosphate epimerase